MQSLDFAGIVHECMRAILEGALIDDAEFQTRLGVDRGTLASILSRWPMVDLSLEGSDEFLAVNNCLNEVANGIEINDKEWSQWFTLPRSEIKLRYKDWCRNR